jgi:uncharacterized protein (DUF58 family)
VTLWPSAKLQMGLGLVVAGIVAAFAMARPEPVIFVAPLAVAIALGVSTSRAAELTVSWAGSQEQCSEGDTVIVAIELTAATDIPTVEVSLALPPGIEAPLGVRVQGTRLAAGEAACVEVEVTCPHWGHYRIEDLWIRVWGPLGLLVAQRRFRADVDISVYPQLQTLRRLARPQEPIAAAGNQVARVKDDGVDFAEVRDFVLGDRARDVNWRVTARRGVLSVNQHHPERSADVVLFVDTFSSTSLEWSVRVATSLVAAYLRNRDRVGVVSLGGIIRWMRPGGGRRQEYLLVQHLLESTVFASTADKDLQQLPPRVLPRKSLVIGVSALEDRRYVESIVDLQGRGVDVVVVEISSDTLTPRTAGMVGETAFRLWILQREATRSRLRELGIPVVVWDHEQPLAPVIEEVAAWPRFARQAG